VKSWDAIIVGAGIIGVSLAIELNKRGMRVLVVEKGELGREASWAAGGMLSDCLIETPAALQALATESARMYPEFVHELEDASRLKIDLRGNGALVFLSPGEAASRRDPKSGKLLIDLYRLPGPLNAIEPELRSPNQTSSLYIAERSVDPRDVIAAAVAAAKHRGVDFSSGNPVEAVEVADRQTVGVRTNKTRYAGGVVVNCAGAWSGQIAIDGGGDTRLSAYVVPTRPVKGQMLYVVMPRKDMVRHVVRSPKVYLIPRSDGRLLIGTTQEEAGFDKQTVPRTIQKLRAAALEIVPALAEARFLEAWAGLRPATPDALPILGMTSTPGYFLATGHFRDGILLAPATAKAMRQVIVGEKPSIDLCEFNAERFQA
jgi:glycine oxidase